MRPTLSAGISGPICISLHLDILSMKITNGIDDKVDANPHWEWVWLSAENQNTALTLGMHIGIGLPWEESTLTTYSRSTTHYILRDPVISLNRAQTVDTIQLPPGCLGLTFPRMPPFSVGQILSPLLSTTLFVDYHPLGHLWPWGLSFLLHLWKCVEHQPFWFDVSELLQEYKSSSAGGASQTAASSTPSQFTLTTRFPHLSWGFHSHLNW